MRKKLLVSMLMLALGFISVDAIGDSYYCSSTNQYVNTGDTLDQVLKSCGTPTHTSTRTFTKTTIRKTAEQIIWVYPNRGISIVFQGNRVIGVNRGNQTSTYSKLCDQNAFITIGMSFTRVQQICGTPIRVINTKKEKKKIVETVWQYQVNDTVPPTSLIFRNGILHQISS